MRSDHYFGDTSNQPGILQNSLMPVTFSLDQKESGNLKIHLKSLRAISKNFKES